MVALCFLGLIKNVWLLSNLAVRGGCVLFMQGVFGISTKLHIVVLLLNWTRLITRPNDSVRGNCHLRVTLLSLLSCHFSRHLQYLLGADQIRRNGAASGILG